MSKYAQHIYNVNETVETEQSEDEWINSITTRENPWKCRLIMNSKTVVFTIDPGASVNMIPFELLVKDKKITHTSKNLKMWNESKVNTMGTIRLLLINPTLSLW